MTTMTVVRMEIADDDEVTLGRLRMDLMEITVTPISRPVVKGVNFFLAARAVKLIQSSGPTVVF